LKKSITIRAGRVAQGVGPEFKPQQCKKKKAKNYAPNNLAAIFIKKKSHKL
jgi:hypothetical protein